MMDDEISMLCARLAAAEQRASDAEEKVRVLREALAGVVGDEPPISDLTNGYPWAGCSYCYGPHYHSAYHKRMGTYRGEYGQEPPPEPGEDEYAPFTEHTADCPWALARAVSKPTNETPKEQERRMRGVK